MLGTTQRCITVLRGLTRRCCTSSLFISNRSKVRPVLSPTLDLQNTFSDLEGLQSSIDARGLSINAIELKEIWNFYNELDTTRKKLEDHRVEIANEIKALKKDSNYQSEMDRLRLKGRIVREDLKKLMESFWEIEEDMMTKCLALPNNLHPDTPLSTSKLIAEYGKKPPNLRQRNHLDVGKDLIDYRGPETYYLKKDAALFEIDLLDYVSSFLKSKRFVPVVAPDFAASAIVEGCGTSPKNALLLAPSDRSIHLVGGTSVYMLATYYAKQSLQGGSLPARHFACGRNYSISNSSGLFGSWQKSCVDLFTIAADSSELEVEFRTTLQVLCELFKTLGWWVRVEYVPAPSLESWESLRVTFKMFAPSLEDFVEVGKISLSKTYISERLSIKYEKKGEDKKFVHILSGTAVNATVALAVILEQKENLLPTNLARYLASKSFDL